MKTTYEFFQNGGADATFADAKLEYALEHPDHKITGAKFEYAYPGRPGEGRWVGIEIEYEIRVVTDSCQ